MQQKYWTFDQSTAATVWDVNNIPDGATGAVVTHVITSTGQILQPENQVISPNGLQLSFGVSPVSGIAYGNYYLSTDQTDDHTVISGEGGTVNITVHQNNGNSSSQ